MAFLDLIVLDWPSLPARHCVSVCDLMWMLVHGCVSQSQMKEMESEISALQKEKDDLNLALATAKASANSSKLVCHSVSLLIVMVIITPSLSS